MVKIILDPKLKFKLAVLSLIASFAAVVFGLYSVSKIADTVVKSKVKVAETERDIILLDKLVEERKLYAGEIRKVKSSLPGKYYEISFFVTQLERLAQNNSLGMEIDIDPDKKDEKGSYSSIIFSLKFTGDYNRVSDFLSQMSKLTYHTSVDNIKMDFEGGEIATLVKLRLFVEK